MKPRAKLWGFVLAVNDLVHDIKATLTPLTAIINSGGFRGGSGGSLEPPPPHGIKLFHFHGEISEKLG